MAGALGLRLCGPASYFGVLHEKPWIGDERRGIVPDDIRRACRMEYAGARLLVLGWNDNMKRIHGGDWAGFESEYGTRPLDFSANISPLGLPDGVRAAASAALADAERYPDPLCRALRAALSEYHGVPEENIVCGNGAAELIWRLCRALRPKKAALFAPTFAEYARALEAEGCEIAYIPLRRRRISAEHGRARPAGTELLFLCNPNNPTGRLAERGVQALLELCRERDALIVDECFLDFCETGGYSLVGALRETPRLVILRAFTKTHAMAGLRLGYALCGSAALAEKLQQSAEPWAVSSIAQAAGVAALREEAYITRLRALVGAERARLIPALEGLRLRVIPGEANFLLFRAEDGALSEKLRRRGILIRPCGNFAGLDENWYRAAVRTQTENDQLLRALGEVLHG